MIATATVRTDRLRGFTLIELVIAIILLGLLSAVGVSMISDSLTTTQIVNANQSNNSQTRNVLERLERELREITFSGGSFAISGTPTATNMVFSRRVENNATTDTQVTICTSSANNANNCGGGSTLTLIYDLSGTITSSTLTDNVSTFSLTYLDSNYAATASPTAIRYVGISLTTTDPTSGQSMAQSTRVALRNFSS